MWITNYLQLNMKNLNVAFRGNNRKIYLYLFYCTCMNKLKLKYNLVYLVEWTVHRVDKSWSDASSEGNTSHHNDNDRILLYYSSILFAVIVFIKDAVHSTSIKFYL